MKVIYLLRDALFDAQDALATSIDRTTAPHIHPEKKEFQRSENRNELQLKVTLGSEIRTINVISQLLFSMAKRKR